MTELPSDPLAVEPVDCSCWNVVGLLAVELAVLLPCVSVGLPFRFVVGPDVLQTCNGARRAPLDAMARQPCLLVYGVFEVWHWASVLALWTHTDRVLRPGSGEPGRLASSSFVLRLDVTSFLVDHMFFGLLDSGVILDASAAPDERVVRSYGSLHLGLVHG